MLTIFTSFIFLKLNFTRGRAKDKCGGIWWVHYMSYFYTFILDLLHWFYANNYWFCLYFILGTIGRVAYKKNYLSIFGHIWTAVSKTAITSSSGLQSSQSSTFSASTEKELQLSCFDFLQILPISGWKISNKIVDENWRGFLGHQVLSKLSLL